MIHDTEGDSVQSVVNTWLQNGDGAQIIIDTDGTITRVVPDDQIAYGTGGNNTGTLNIELIGHASQTKEQWLANSAQLSALKSVLGYWSAKYNIPLVQSTEHGVSTHAMNSAIYPQSDGHSDPGPNFPFQQVIQAAGGSVSTTSQPKGYEWEGALADKLGVPYSPAMKKFFDAWNANDRSSASNNPFNITVDYTGGSTGTLSGNTAGVLNFATALDGVNATAAFIQKNVPSLINDLKKGNFKGASQTIQDSGWAGKGNTTYGAGIYSTFQSGTAINVGTNAPSQLSPTGKAQVSVQQSTETLQQQAHDQAYLGATVAKASALAQAKVAGHETDPWVTVLTDKKGNITGLGEAIGMQPPKNVLTIGGQPATRQDYQLAWSQTYASDYEAYTGKPATPAVQVQILESGQSLYQMRQRLANQPGFTSSPIYKQSAAGIADAVKTATGKAAPKSFVRDAIAQGWDSATVSAKIKQLPGYTSGPEYRQNFAQNVNTFQSIYGMPNNQENAWLKHVTLQGWSTDEIAGHLRSDPAYKYSPEYQAKAINFLDAMGMFTGTRPIAGIQSKLAVKNATQGSALGAPPKDALQISTGAQ